MNLKHRLSLYSITVFSIVILLASAAIYFSFYKRMEQSELISLKDKTLLAAIYYLEADESGVVERQTVIDQLRKSILRSNIAVFNDKNDLVRGEMGPQTDISKNYLDRVRSRDESSFVTKDYFYNGLFYKDNEGDFVVITRESKQEFNRQLLTLLQILIIVFLVGIVMVYIFSNLLGKFAFQPLTNIIDQIKQRDNVNFTKPLQTKDSYTEIQDLVKSYNLFIERIDKTFIIQKNFIDYVSHELRTPITALLLTLEVTHHKDRSKEEYKQVLNQLNQYVVDLEETLDNMMLLSGAKTKFEFAKIHVDEIIWQVVEQMILYHNAQIEVNILVKNSDFLIINGNPQLLQLALNNIIENAIKYSDNQPIKILFEDKNNHLEISVFDTGIGIPLEDVPNITANFFRGQNTQYYTGKGIGLSMANVIFTLHNIQLQLKNNQPKGTIAKLSFPKND